MCLTIKEIRKWPPEVFSVITAIGVIFSILFSIRTFFIGLHQYENINRPNLGPEHLFFDKEYDGQNILLQIPLRNYGKSPAYFYAEYSGLGQKKAFQEGNHIFPDQRLELSWQTSLSGLSGVSCYIIRDGNEKITIDYGKDKNNLKYRTVFKRKETPIPDGSTLFGNKKVYSAQCENGWHAFPWHIEDRY